MIFNISRRRFLACSAAAGLVPAIPDLAHAAMPLRLAVERRTLEVSGQSAAVFGIRGPDGTPGIALDPGQRFRLTLQNSIDEPTILHWHGQTPPAPQDGVADTGYVGPLPPGGARDYDFEPRSGTHWMHSHHGLQEQLLMAAPLIVRTADDLRLDAQEVTVLLHDFTFKSPAEIVAGLNSGNALHGHMTMHSMDGGDMSGMSGMPDMIGMAAMPGMDLNDVEYDAFLANDRTLDDPLVVTTERGGQIRLRLINGATSTAFWIELGGQSATVIAADGNAVEPVTDTRFPLAQGQRLDLLLRMPAGGGVMPVLAQREGALQRTGILLAAPGATVARVATLGERPTEPIDLSLEQRLTAATPLTAKPADVTHRIALGGTMMPYAWSIDGRTWADHRPLRVSSGQRVLLEMVNRSPMAHPMHLHGHHFQPVTLNGKAVSGPLRDTVLVPVNGQVSVAFDAINPGRWLLHCHNLFHMATGMMTELAYENVT